MNIIYHKNPLYTTVELDSHEKEIFKLKIRIRALEEMLHSGHFILSHHEWHNANISKSKARTLEETVQEAINELEPKYWLDETNGKTDLDNRVDDIFNNYIAELAGNHIGDCTCVPCSCEKCIAEEILGINTIAGLGKHEASKINSAFGKNNEKSTEEVLEYLKNYEPGPFVDIGNPNWTQANHDRHVPRWRNEGKKAYEWLLNYSKLHNLD